MKIRIVILAVAVSLLIHVFLLFALPKWSEFTQKEVVLEARLMPQFKPLAPPKPKLKPKPHPKPKVEQSPVDRQAPVVEEKPKEEMPKEETSVEQPKIGKAKNDVPEKAELIFDGFYGTQGFKVGRGISNWEIGEDGRYSIRNTFEPTGIAAIIGSLRKTWKSEGSITDEGLRPDSFSVKQGDSPEQSAKFDWSALTLTLSGGKEVKLVPHAQDQLSILFQFAFAHPVAGIFSFIATDARKLDSYEYEILGEEFLETPMGNLKTIHLKKIHNEGVEGTEIWLAVDHYYWPVKILITSRKGESFEQTISEIRKK